MTMPAEPQAAAAERDQIEDARMALHLASLGAVDLVKWARTKLPALLDEAEAARAALARVAAMVDHGLHSEDPDEHDCDTHPCWAVALRKAIGIEETP